MSCKIINFSDIYKKYHSDKKPQDDSRQSNNSDIVSFSTISIPSGIYKLPKTVYVNKNNGSMFVNALIDIIKYYGWKRTENANRPDSPDNGNCIFEISTISGYKVPDDFKHTVSTCAYLNDATAVHIFEAMAEQFRWQKVGDQN